MAEKRFLSPDTLAAPFGYSHVVDSPAGRIVYISGQVPLDGDGQLVGAGDFEAQARQVFENLTRALEAADAAWDDVVKLNYFLRDVVRPRDPRRICQHVAAAGEHSRGGERVVPR